MDDQSDEPAVVSADRCVDATMDACPTTTTITTRGQNSSTSRIQPPAIIPRLPGQQQDLAQHPLSEESQPPHPASAGREAEVDAAFQSSRLPSRHHSHTVEDLNSEAIFLMPPHRAPQPTTSAREDTLPTGLHSSYRRVASATVLDPSRPTLPEAEEPSCRFESSSPSFVSPPAQEPLLSQRPLSTFAGSLSTVSGQSQSRGQLLQQANQFRTSAFQERRQEFTSAAQTTATISVSQSLPSSSCADERSAKELEMELRRTSNNYRRAAQHSHYLRRSLNNEIATPPDSMSSTSTREVGGPQPLHLMASSASRTADEHMSWVTIDGDDKSTDPSLLLHCGSGAQRDFSVVSVGGSRVNAHVGVLATTTSRTQHGRPEALHVVPHSVDAVDEDDSGASRRACDVEERRSSSCTSLATARFNPLSLRGYSLSSAQHASVYHHQQMQPPGDVLSSNSDLKTQQQTKHWCGSGGVVEDSDSAARNVLDESKQGTDVLAANGQRGVVHHGCDSSGSITFPSVAF